MPTWAKLLTYQAFVSGRAGWRLYDGLGDRGRLIQQAAGAPWARYVAQTAGGGLWITHGSASVEWVVLPDLSREPVPSPGRRVGALAAEPFGARVLVTDLPEDAQGRVRLLVWESPRWREVDMTPPADISSALAWLDADRVVFESVNRRLTILDLGTGVADELFGGRLPAAAPLARTWFAVSGNHVVQVPYDRLVEPRAVTGFQFGSVTSQNWSPDGEACLWKQPKFSYRSKGFAQRRGTPRIRVRSLDEGVGAIIQQ